MLTLVFSTDRSDAITRHDDGDSVGFENSLDMETDESTVFLPILTKRYPKPLSIFGVENNRFTVLNSLDRAVDANVSWVRYNGIKWYEVEPVSVDNPDGYDWSKLNTFDAEHY